MVRERWWVTKLGVKDGVRKMVCDKVVCERGCVKDGATPATQNEGGCEIVPRLPRKTNVDVTKCHTCHVKRKWMSPSATPATQTAAASRATKPGPRAPPNAISATPATQNDRGCEFVPQLPRETKVDVTKCHACHAKCRGVTGDKSGPKRATQYHKCHACHAKRPWM